MTDKYFAYTGPTPPTGYVGYINVQETAAGIKFTVRSEGENPSTSCYNLPWDRVKDIVKFFVEADNEHS